MRMFNKRLTVEGIAHPIVGHPTLFDLVFTDQSVRDYRDVQNSDTNRNEKFNTVMRVEGIFKSPGKTYPSLALTEADFEQTDYAISVAAKSIA